jgi:monoamine oxidase
MLENINATSLAGFENYVNELKSTIKRQYDRCVNKDLSQQKWQDLFRRNIVDVLNQAYDHSLTQIEQLSTNIKRTDKFKIHYGASGKDHILKYFDGFTEDLIQYALHKHRSSCALSNFPDEHNPSQEYIAEVIQQANHEWEYFVFQLPSVMAK